MHVKFPLSELSVFSKYSMWLWLCVKILGIVQIFLFCKKYRTIMYHIYVRNTLGLKVTERSAWLLEC